MWGALFRNFPNKLADTSKNFVVFILSSHSSLWKRSGDIMNVHEFHRNWMESFGHLDLISAFRLPSSSGGSVSRFFKLIAPVLLLQE